VLPRLPRVQTYEEIAAVMDWRGGGWRLEGRGVATGGEGGG